MDLNKLIQIGLFLNTQGYDIDLKDDFWMEEYRFHEHKVRDIAELLEKYIEFQNQPIKPLLESVVIERNKDGKPTMSAQWVEFDYGKDLPKQVY